AARRQADAIREIIGGATSVHFDERRDDDFRHLAGLIVGDGQGDFGQAADEVDRLAPEADRAAFLRVLAEDRVDDLRGQRRQQPRLELAGEDVRLRIALPRSRVAIIVLRVGDAEQVARIERIAAEARIDRLVNDILGERGRRKSYPRATQKDCGSTNRATTRRHWTPYRTSVALLAPPIRCQVFPVPAIAKVNEGLVTSDPIRIPHSG